MSSFRASTAVTFDRSRIADQIFRDLREQIVLGSLPHGAKLPPEKDLAEKYRVSGATVREAVRGLTATGLVDVRHGSGAYVIANSESLIAMSLSTVIQLEGVGAAEVLAVLGNLNEYASREAATRGTDEDHARLRAAMLALEAPADVDKAAAAVRGFHRALVMAAHNPLLTALCGFLADMQTQLATELTGESLEHWRKILSGLKKNRAALVAAVEARDPEEAQRVAREFHTKAAKLILSLPRAEEVRVTDPKFRSLVSSMMSRVTQGS
jgi:GntR family transcriptional repressor for pyruvate dehydrogenase complex